MPAFSRVIIVGASSGIGRDLAKLFAREGSRVAVVSRRLDRLTELVAEFPDHILPFVHDVTDYDVVPGLFQKITMDLGGLDLVIYNAGIMERIGPTEFDFSKDRAMVETNFLGAIAWLNEAASRFQNVRSGTIVGIGSVAGDRGRAGQPVYNASKAALATYLEALRNRLSRFGVRVVTIKPGPVETEMTAGLHLRGMMSAAQAAKIIHRKLPHVGEHYLKASHRVIFAIIKWIPSTLFRRLNI